jgi:uncharacterized repeat protein (TIGR03837 family)
VSQTHWDIFCSIVDNYGDIGVCWRLAKQLQREHGLQVRLWVDDLHVAQRLIPALNPALAVQTINHVTVTHWCAQAEIDHAAEVVIEAFACGLPERYLTAMHGQKSKWVNLEYLSAEPWVDAFHAKPSPKQGLTRYFYFPGFTPQTGGLIRERDVDWYISQASDSESVQKSPSIFTLLQTWIPDCAGMAESESDAPHLNVSLFCYPHAPVAELLTAMASSHQAITCFVPMSNRMLALETFFGKDTISVGDNLRYQQLNVQVLPFLSQTDYDQLLRACDVNFVRGEDSWVRAIWAGKPFIWQPYFQDENTHLTKLNAFLATFYAGFSPQAAVQGLHDGWVTGAMSSALWTQYLQHLGAIHQHTTQQAQHLVQQPDLATQLVDFCHHL